MAALTLEKEGIDLAAQILCYSFIGEVLDGFNALSQEQQSNLPATLFVLADNDPISNGSLEYETALRGAGVDTDIKKYDGSIHGFLEENNPEYEALPAGAASKSPEQEAMARNGEAYIGEWLAKIWRHKGSNGRILSFSLPAQQLASSSAVSLHVPPKPGLDIIDFAQKMHLKNVQINKFQFCT